MVVDWRGCGQSTDRTFCREDGTPKFPVAWKIGILSLLLSRVLAFYSTALPNSFPPSQNHFHHLKCIILLCVVLPLCMVFPFWNALCLADDSCSILYPLLKLYLLCEVSLNWTWKNWQSFDHKTIAPSVSNIRHSPLDYNFLIHMTAYFAYAVHVFNYLWKPRTLDPCLEHGKYQWMLLNVINCIIKNWNVRNTLNFFPWRILLI